MRFYCKNTSAGRHDFDEVEYSQYLARLSEKSQKDYILSQLCPKCFIARHRELDQMVIQKSVSPSI